MGDYYDDSKKTSEFNEAIFQLQRLNFIWIDSRKNRENGNYQKYKSNLDSATIELSPDIVRLDNENIMDKNYISYKRKIEQINNEIERSALMRNRNLLYKKLMEKEILLRNIQEDAGKGGKLIDPDDDEVF